MGIYNFTYISIFPFWLLLTCLWKTLELMIFTIESNSTYSWAVKNLLDLRFCFTPVEGILINFEFNFIGLNFLKETTFSLLLQLIFPFGLTGCGTSFLPMKKSFGKFFVRLLLMRNLGILIEVMILKWTGNYKS